MVHYVEDPWIKLSERYLCREQVADPEMDRRRSPSGIRV